MSTPSTPASKRGPVAQSVTDELMPLLFAAHSDLVPNYGRMSELSGGKFTKSAIEHRFRAHRARGAEIRKAADLGEGDPSGCEVKNGASNGKRKTVSGTTSLEGSPTKKARVNKKGIAKVIKKKAVASEDEGSGGDDKEGTVKKEMEFVEEG